jgi:hypothetical protein
MLRWKLIMERWHLTYEDMAICRLVVQVASQTSGKVCLACMDSIADARLQWLSLDLTELMTTPDLEFFLAPFTDVKNVEGIFYGEFQSITDDQE